VAYRRAPEHPFPAAHDDALAAFRWAQDHALHLGADPTRVTVGGDSAGGNLATATAQATRDDRPPAAQLVIYPAVDTPTDRPSRSLFDGFFLADGERSGYFEVYTRGTGAPADDPRLSPIYGPLDGLAPAFVVVAGFDVLRDESEAYAEALRAAGTRVVMQREPSLPHAFINMTGVSRTAHRATAEMAHRWREVVATVR
jgi:acetyl esterase